MERGPTSRASTSGLESNCEQVSLHCQPRLRLQTRTASRSPLSIFTASRRNGHIISLVMAMKSILATASLLHQISTKTAYGHAHRERYLSDEEPAQVKLGRTSTSKQPRDGCSGIMETTTTPLAGASLHDIIQRNGQRSPQQVMYVCMYVCTYVKLSHARMGQIYVTRSRHITRSLTF